MPQVTVNGFRLNYEQMGEGTPFVYIAGTRFDSAKASVPYMQQHASGFRVILPDPRGMAGSQRVADIEPQDWVSDLGGLLDALHLPQVHLAAETLGSRIATRFAADHPDRVRTLILNAPIAYSTPTGDQARQRGIDFADEPAARRQALQQHHGTDWPDVNAFYLNLHARPEFHQFYDLRQAIGRVTAPVLIVRGDVDDPVHPIRHAAELHEVLPSSWLAILPHTE